jgi:triacylglycerol esterase/lipase EstA (alpha/beta hydrolase family)
MRITWIRRVTTGLVTVGLAVTAGLLVGSPPAGAAAPPTQGPRVDDFFSALDLSLLAPGLTPHGANDPACHSADHPLPVVLVHGTLENQFDNFARLAPQLVSAGYCVWSLNYGGTGAFRGTGHVADSAGRLARFVDSVLRVTGASKVDIVGHSQGGMMPRYYLKNLGGAAVVDKLIGLVPSNQGTTLDGLTGLAQLIGAGPLIEAVCGACTDQIAGSAFLRDLGSGNDGVLPGVGYTVIASTHDEVVTPFTNAFLPPGPGVTNETLQQFCPGDTHEHITISYDPVAIQLVRNALDPAHAAAPRC